MFTNILYLVSKKEKVDRQETGACISVPQSGLANEEKECFYYSMYPLSIYE